MATRAKKDERDERDEREEGDDPDVTESPEAEAPAKKQPRRQASEASGPMAALIEGLDQIVPGLVVLDRELAFEGGARADLAAVDPSGRLYLVLLADEDADRAALEALDAVGVVRMQLDLLLRHFGEEQVNPERSPRVLVVSPGSDTRLADRLAVLLDAGVLVFGLRSVRSVSGERAYLVRLQGSTPAAAGSSGVAAFLRTLPARLESLGNALVERMERLDEELVPLADSTSIVWRIADEVLCRVERVGDLLQASVAPRHEPQSLGDMGDLERLVERALARLVRILGLTRTEPEPPGLRGGGDEPILSPEEIQAFRE